MRIQRPARRAAAFVCLLSLAVRATPALADNDPCIPWMGTARTWTYSDNGVERRRTLRQCGGVPAGALSYARRCMEKFGDRLASRTHVIIGDFSTNNNFVRLHVLEWRQDDPEASVPLLRGGLMHGVGNDHDAATGVPRVALDQWESNATPGGCMRLFGRGDQQTLPTVARNLQAYRLDGLEYRNACTEVRGVYFHESYLSENGINLVETRRFEEATRRDMSAADFSRIRPGRNLGTTPGPGCVVASNDDFDFIKASGVVPDPGAGWRPSTPTREREGILFVSWFWGDADNQTLVSRYESPRRSCTDPNLGVMTPAIPRTDPNIPALRQLENLQWD
jgi:hypothetical protein